MSGRNIVVATRMPPDDIKKNINNRNRDIWLRVYCWESDGSMRQRETQGSQWLNQARKTKHPLCECATGHSQRRRDVLIGVAMRQMFLARGRELTYACSEHGENYSERLMKVRMWWEEGRNKKARLWLWALASGGMEGSLQFLDLRKLSTTVFLCQIPGSIPRVIYWRIFFHDGRRTQNTTNQQQSSNASSSIFILNLEESLEDAFRRYYILIDFQSNSKADGLTNSQARSWSWSWRKVVEPEHPGASSSESVVRLHNFKLLHPPLKTEMMVS